VVERVPDKNEVLGSIPSAPTSMIKKMWEKPLCNLCRSADYKILYNDLTYWEYPGVFQVVKCNKCSLVFLNPRPKLNEIKKYYDQISYFAIDKENFETSVNELNERDKAYGKEYSILLANKKKGRILDIGAGTGAFLSKFKELGWLTEGVELNPDAVMFAKKNYKISLREGDFSSFRFRNNYYDIITLNGALEHLYDPQETLKKVHKLLRKNGVILFSVPNVNSFGRIIFGKQWFPWLPPQHLYHFSPETAKAMLDNALFKKVTILHDSQVQNYYILFQSLRYAKSPKFKTKKTGGLATTQYKNTFSLKKELGKIAGTLFAFTISMVEPFLRRGEVIIVYAQK
jgi:2-polyprenyl-3-methyl-5-hydroxy-6-metoxy-1,4-benzoquinol methylase